MNELYALTQIKKTKLKKKGYKYEEIWEHEWLHKVKNNAEINAFICQSEVIDRLNPRDSFYGGRTNASRLYHKAKDGEKIKYYDFTSLYPYVNKNKKYPKGHPEIITSDFLTIDQYFGIAKVSILPPRGLYHPVLPYRMNNKLLFSLCRKCTETENKRKCTHTDEDRTFMGTWCTPEIMLALEKGYLIKKIHEVYHFPETLQYDRESMEDGLFSKYVNTFLKIKQEASGWPKWCTTDQAKTKYINDYLEVEGILLDRNSIEYNPGLRAIAKLILNSFWGKFAQRQNLDRSTFYHEAEVDKFFQDIADPGKIVTDFQIVNEKIIHVQWKFHKGFVPENKSTNIFLASFTTCWARLKLYDVLDKLGERVLYYDTDSVIFLSQEQKYEPKLGDFLGYLTNELDEGDYITEFVSGGPKNYTYSTIQGKQVCKIRGFSLNFENSQKLNFDMVKEMVLDTEPSSLNRKKRKLEDPEQECHKKVIITTNPHKISRDKTSTIVYNRQENKRYSVVYNKRVIQENLNTLPYGF